MIGSDSQLGERSEDPGLSGGEWWRWPARANTNTHTHTQFHEELSEGCNKVGSQSPWGLREGCDSSYGGVEDPTVSVQVHSIPIVTFPSVLCAGRTREPVEKLIMADSFVPKLVDSLCSVLAIYTGSSSCC